MCTFWKDGSKIILFLLKDEEKAENMLSKKEKKRSSHNEDSWLRKKIFRTRCTSGGKVCKVIIDSGSCENMVSQEMVDKLKLHYDKHPHRY